MRTVFRVGGLSLVGNWISTFCQPHRVTSGRALSREGDFPRRSPCGLKASFHVNGPFQQAMAEADKSPQNTGSCLSQLTRQTGFFR